MLDFSRVRTPPNHGDTLVEPARARLGELARHNYAALSTAKARILDTPLSRLRFTVRQHLGLPEDAILYVTGHQPEFIHAGVWAKHVVAARLGRATDGLAVNLIVDHDAPRDMRLRVPTVEGDSLGLRSVPFALLKPGLSYDQAPALSGAELEAIERAIHDAMGRRFDETLMPVFLKAKLDPSGDWVDQVTAARQAIEDRFDTRMIEYRASEIPWQALAAEIVLNADRFARTYNAALGAYRLEQRVRDLRRPIPNLIVDGDRVEIPCWLYRRGEPRRRAFVRRRGDRAILYANDREEAELDAGALGRFASAGDELAKLEPCHLRPRALTLTLWSRLFLADLFIHGIGGAKYDRITDRILEAYFGIRPPGFACVSATMLIDLPAADARRPTPASARHLLRDVSWNPQRHLAEDDETRPLFQERRAAVVQADRLRTSSPREHRERRDAFERTRRINRELLELRPKHLQRAQQALLNARDAARREKIAADRTYFIGLFAPERLAKLLDALPAINQLR